VNVSQPSDALTARATAAGAFDSLFLGLGVVALIVGAVGVANIMIISVLDAARRSASVAPLVRRRARSGRSSSVSRSCSPSSAASSHRLSRRPSGGCRLEQASAPPPLIASATAAMDTLSGGLREAVAVVCAEGRGTKYGLPRVPTYGTLIESRVEHGRDRRGWRGNLACWRAGRAAAAARLAP
jgi:hypothetical protein